MTPVFRSLMKKVLGTTPEDGDSPDSAPPPRAALNVTQDDLDDRLDDGDSTEGDEPSEDGAPRRRRGRRGGRNRRKRTDGDTTETTDAPAAPAVRTARTSTPRATATRPSAASTTAETPRAGSAVVARPIVVARRRPGAAAAPVAAPAEARSYGWGRRVDGDEARDSNRGRRDTRRTVRPRDMQHEPPLPEDLAFRSPPEGGDRTIFPGRRKRPQGIREDERVLLAGPRSLGGWIEHDIPLQPYEAYLPRPYAVAVALNVHDPFALVAPDGVAINPPLVPAVDPVAVALEIEAITEVVTPLTDGSEPAGEDEIARKHRRRGRRGGRNRRRGTDATPLDPSDDADADGPSALAPFDDDHAIDLDMDVDDVNDTPLAVSEFDTIKSPPAMSEFDAIESPVLDVAPPAPVVVRAASRFRSPATASEDDRPRVAARRSTRAASPEPEAAAPRVVAPRADAPKPVARKREVVETPALEAEQPKPTARRPRPAPVVADPLTYPQAFVALGATERTLPALATFGFQTPTPIQEQAIPALLNGRDVVGIAKTGSGKTVAFGVPMVEKLDADLGEVQGLVLVPTRELAQQVLEVLQLIAAPRGMQAIGLLGGHAIRNDLQAIERRPAIVVGTPGRIIDHLQRGTLSLRHVTYAVLDEADQMLDIGFLPDIRRILGRTPKRRQTALFSATMPGSIRRLIWQFMVDPQQVAVDAESTPVDSIEQIYFEVAHRDKAAGLRELIERELKGRTLVFCKTKRAVDMLEANLSRMGVRVGALHGDMDQRHRDHVIADFRVGTLDVLVATNVAARGLDIPEITHVLNFDVPQNAEEYIHRIGRTGRAGREGKAITFVSEWDMQEFDAIRAEFGERLHEERLDLYRPRVAPRSTESAGTVEVAVDPAGAPAAG